MLPQLDGSKLRLSLLRGHVVVLDFWAPWSKPCLDALPKLKQWHQQLQARGVVVIGVTTDEISAVRPFVATHDLRYPIALDQDKTAMDAFAIRGLPTTIVIDQHGVIRHIDVGRHDVAAIESSIMKLIQR